MGRQGQLRSWSDARACAAAWALLCVAAPPGLAEPAPAPAGQDAALRRAPSASAADEVDALLRAARFEEAVARGDALREELGTAEGERLRVRLEVAAGTAYVALEREEAARECFRRALAAEPALDLDPAATAPKVLRVFRSVRAEPRSSR
jgi:hypothetical protein